MTPETYRSPIALFDSISDADLTRFGIKLGVEFEMILDGRHERSRVGDFRRDCANDFIRTVGGNLGLCTSSYGHQHGGEYTNWDFTGDGSLSGERDRDVPLELVSPIFNYADMFPTFTRVRDWCLGGRAYTNNSCGMHTGVSATRNPSRRDFDPVLFSIMVDDHAVLSRCGRLTNTYAPATWRYFFNNLRGRESRISSALDRPSNLRQTVASVADEIGLSHRRYTVNYGHLGDRDYVEYRSPGGNWLELPPNYIQALFRRVAIAYLVAGGQLSHPELMPIYAARLAYAMRQGAPEQGADLFISGRLDVVPSVLRIRAGDCFWVKLGSTAGNTYYLQVQTNSNSDTLNNVQFYFTAEDSAPSRLCGHGPVLSIVNATSQWTGAGYFPVDNRGATQTLRFEMSNRRPDAIHTIRASLLLAHWARNTASTSPLRASFVTSLRERVPGHALRDYMEVAAQCTEKARAVIEMVNSADVRSSFRTQAHRAWLNSASDRVRRQAIHRAVSEVRSRLDGMAVSPLTRTSVLRILDQAESNGTTLSASHLSNVFRQMDVHRREVASRELLLLATFPEAGVNHEQILNDHTRTDAMMFVSAEHTLSVFTQQTDAAPYAQLRSLLRPVLSSSHDCADASTTTQRVRRTLIEGAARLPRNVRRCWKANGAHAVLSDRLRSRAIRPYLLGAEA